jgi:phosphoenolpyruvate carboxykinase (ATP)
MVHHPAYYAEILKRKVLRYGVNCWLLNTGWVGGPYGVGKRISIRYTRALLNAALNGSLDAVEYYSDPVFQFQIPKSSPGVPDEILNPASSWPSAEDFMKRYKGLASRFIDNFKKFEDAAPPEVKTAGPKL